MEIMWCSILGEIDDWRITVNLQFYSIMSPLLVLRNVWEQEVYSMCPQWQFVNEHWPQLKHSENGA